MDKYEKFESLHHQDVPLFLPNAWNVSSAIIIEQAGYQAIGTTSYGISNANGYNDGENLTFDTLLETSKKIIEAVELPVSVDMEAGFSDDADNIAENALKVANIGAVGINIEDSRKTSKGLRSISEQSTIISTIKKTLADNGFKHFFINARIDTYLQAKEIEETIDRITSCIESGASGVFLPGLTQPEEIKRIVDIINDTPLNLVSLPKLTSVEEIGALGVKRFSMGNALSSAVIAFTEKIAREVLHKGSTYVLFERDKIQTRFKG